MTAKNESHFSWQAKQPELLIFDGVNQRSSSLTAIIWELIQADWLKLLRASPQIHGAMLLIKLW